jgi:NADH-quinone oxidoreductase subunit F
VKEHILTAHTEEPGFATLEGYVKHGGYEGLKAAVQSKNPDQIIEEVNTSGLRGRGGAGFPTGKKWKFLVRDSGRPCYLICNADEGEPGTFKDKFLLDKAPHMVLEGMILSCVALQVCRAFIYMRGEFKSQAERFEQAIAEAKNAGFLGDSILGSGFSLDVTVHHGAGAYICGEETSLMESLEGKRGYPRLKPPFPAAVGLFGCPTVINNVETLANVPWIVRHGGQAYAGYGTEKSAGTRLFSISGNVRNPGVYEVELGSPLLYLVNDLAGGVPEGRKLKAVIPGGTSVPVLTAAEAEKAHLDFESLEQLGTMLGSGGVIVFDDTASMVDALHVITRFYANESCGQCTPCREGTGWALKIVEEIVNGRAARSHLELLESVAQMMNGTTICPLGEAAALPILGFLQKFRGELEEFISHASRGEPVHSPEVL